MGITIKTKSELAIMREAGRITCGAIWYAGEKLRAGMSTLDVDKLVGEYYAKHGCKSCFKGLYGFPANACISVNEEIIHGIPKASHRLKEGDIVSCDIVVTYKGYNGDACRTYRVGKVSEEADRLIRVTEECLACGLALVKEGVHLSDISAAIQKHAEENGYSLVREFTGHGIGKGMHEDPMIPNYGEPGHGPKLKAGMTLAIEPMVLQGRKECYTLDDGWTTKTCDGKLAAHHENTIVVTKEGYEILTKL